MSVEFCDTNVLVYAYDRSAGPKHELARTLVMRLWETESGAVSVQVLQELFVTVTRKAAKPLDLTAARQLVADLATWQVAVPDAADVLSAIDATVRWQTSFWDAMILVAAASLGADVIWSEDLQHGQDFDGVVIRNPFR
jgi:predicted nucleic acid-binding protein